ncbi:mannose-binding protein [Streptomyces finlayi]|uniref:Mannose-binding protein n=1 Tax=Streptomyces finlayi TaxID=67296 RepID=A0A7G7BUD9_9ACTN|nr:mannose-binding protein [Streptomyces finlayi]QNE78954.1 mannose-binding protein [Streptomyces finlayi]
MSPHHPALGANAAAASAPGAQEPGSPASGTPAEETSSTAAATAAAAVAEAESGTAPAGETIAAPSESTASTPAPTTEAPEEGTGAAAAVGTAPGTRTSTGADSGRPRTPVLAGAAFVGAALVAIPLLLIGSADDKGQDTVRPVAGGTDTVLNPHTAPAAIEDYVAGKPSASATTEKPKREQRVETPKSAAPKPVVPAPEPRTSRPAEKKPTPTSKPEPKAAPKPNWSTVTVSAPSVLEVNQAWTTNRIRMVMQPDGNLVVLNELGKPIWAAMTFGPNHRANFQPDGNLVIHNGDGRPIWASKTHDHGGAQLVFRADAKVVIVHNGRVVWST